MAPTISPPGIGSAANLASADASSELALAFSLPAVSASSLFMLVGVVGTAFAIFGMIANCLLAILFLTRAHYRQSPFFFLGFAVPVHAEYLHDVAFIHKWINVMPLLYYLGQIFKMASTFSLIVASIERYCMTKHWTFTGFESRTRWIVLVLVVIVAVLLKIVTNEVVLIERPHCDELYRYTIGSVTRNDSTLLGIIGMASIAVPFVTLIFLNGGIVMMLRRQNVQQLRSLITQLTMGKDVMKMRRKNLRAATNTLLAIITAYLISNALNLALTMLEFVDRDFLYADHPIAYRFAADTAGVLTAVGNAIRCPAHFVSNSEIRNQFYVLFTGEPKEEKARSALHDFAHLTGSSRRNSHKYAHTPPPRRRMGSESLQSAWFSLLLNVKNEDEESEEEMERKESMSELPSSPFLLLNAPRMSFKRHSAIAIC
ncbi:hypothetical protein PRIPAC_81251 [Pristionchus pacificus]|uniref:G protein-coupled receptor n=1 Tax=Pristionchus pacificus TaxID=54126 RepID=A0A2A6CK29_PRIPA|nr:hypothetical protein PRIPAC_81251 [Pristionchus pacificus]|eukprot:PDM78460.1 G protein-coupled receptor [Pristionchus pacificus]